MTASCSEPPDPPDGPAPAENGASMAQAKKQARTRRGVSRQAVKGESAPQNETVLHISELKPDSRNARRHNPRNIGMVADSLKEHGAARSIVINEDNGVMAGNATLAAAAEAGITSVRVIDATGDELIAVRRSGLTKRQQTRLALADNRASELADWEPDVLRELKAEDLDGFFHPEELEEILGVPPDDGGEKRQSEGAKQKGFGVVIVCSDADEQRETFERLTTDGLTCAEIDHWF